MKMRTTCSLVLVLALGACTGSRTLIEGSADPSLTGDDPLAGATIEDGMGCLDDVCEDDQGDGTGAGDEGAAGIGATDGSTGTGTPDQPAAPADPFADLIATLFGGGTGAGAAPADPAAANPFADLFGGGAAGGSADSGASGSGGSGDAAPASDPFADLIALFLEFILAFLGGAGA